MSNLGSSDSPQVKLIHEWGQGFENRDLSLIAKSLHKDYRHITYPRSLGMPEIAREQWLENFARVISLWTAGQEPSMQSVIIADVPGKVVVHVTNKVQTLIGVEGNRESIIIAHIVTDEDGSLKIKQVEEFMDSKAHLDFVQAIATATAGK